MKISRLFVRTLFLLLSLFFMAAYIGGAQPTPLRIGIGALIGLAYGGTLIGFEQLFRKVNLRTFNVVMVGLFFGYLFGLALLLCLKAVVATTLLSPTSELYGVIKIALFLFGAYMGVLLALRSADELYISLPFIRLSKGREGGNDLLLSPSALTDPRLVDLAASGLLDRRLILPRFVVSELYAQSEYPDEGVRLRGRKGIEAVQRLQGLAHLEMRAAEAEFPDAHDPFQKLVRLARLSRANILTADPTPIQLAPEEIVRVVNLNTVAQALKPIAQGSESFVIKIQRYGKGRDQGVGYTEEGAMVVVNGGGDYIGEEVKVRVISMQQTTAGRIIFCNLEEEEFGDYSRRRRDEYELSRN
ncbi:MAG: TRAM domain-containing protein [Parachlamydiales bacterium]